MSKKKKKKSDRPQPPRPDRDSLETVDEQNTASDRPVMLASGSASADDPETWEEDGGGATFEADSDLSPDVLKTMTLAWQGAIEPGTSPRMTVKGNVVDAGTSRDTQETWVEPGTEPVIGAGLATVADADAPAATSPPPAPADADDGADQTFLSDLSDEFAPAAREDDGGTTLPEAADDEARQRETDDERTMMLPPEQGESIDRTQVSSEFEPLSPEQPVRDEGQRTEADRALDAGMQQAAADSEDSFEATLISDSHSGPEHVETMESGTRGVPARKTSPDETEMPFVDDQTDLVIKVRAFRQQDGTGPKDAEYQINRVLGEGGMGIVYDAVQTSINRSVAVKMMKKPKPGRKLEQYAASRHKFLAEAVVTGDLDHPNIVPIYDVGRDDKQALFYSMKNVVGTPWLDVIRARSVHENLEVLMRVADAVAFAHARGVVHRDLKPENVMLGEFGEILLMDWGLALPTQKFRKGESVRRTSSMGGTPAYMAPEMATGPIEKIGAWSDIYLLGAILYEILTGKPPHRGKNAMKCLMAAAKNQIEPTDKSGELLDIAMKAMATNPEARHRTVQDFQAAIREYLSHTESITLSARAEDDLLRARQTSDYEDFQQAVFGFKESYELWKGNKRAVAGLGAARLAYAECAFKKEDYDLGISQLDLSDPQHAALHGRLVAAKGERDARVQRIKTMKRVGLVAGLLFLVTAGSLTVWAMTERGAAIREGSRARLAEADALEQKGKAESAAQLASQEADRARLAEADAVREAERARIAEQEAKTNLELAKRNEERALEQESIAKTNLETAERNEREAKRQEGIALEQKAAAEEARADAERSAQIAEARRVQAEDATRRAIVEEQRARYEAYIAQIGLASAKIDENSFESARAILEQVPHDQRNWEWGRLMYLCGQQKDQYSVGARVDAVAITGDGKYFMAGSHDGTALIFDATKSRGDQAAGAEADQARLVLKLKHADGAQVRAVAFSDDSTLAATAGTDNIARVWRIDWSAGRAEEVQQLEGHTRPINSVQFSHDGRRLLTGSADRTARLWDLATARPLRVLLGHYDAVSAAAFAPRWMTDPESGALVWKNGKRQWAVDAAGNRLSETSIVTASLDGTAVVWTSKSGRWLPDDPDLKQADQDVQQSTPFRGHGRQPVFAAAFSPRGDRVATGGYDQRVLVWDPEQLRSATDNLENVKTGDGPVAATVKIDRELVGHTNQVSAVTFSADGEYLVSGGRDNTVKVWDIASGRPVTTFRGHSEVVQACAVDPEGRWVLSGSHDALVKKWSVADYEESRVFDLRGREFSGHGGTAVLGATFSGDGNFIVTAGQDRRAKSWDVNDAREFRNEFVEGHAYLASSAVFAPESKRLLTGAADTTVRLWDTNTGGEIAKLEGTGRTAAIALSADEQWILTGGGSREAVPADGIGQGSIWKARLWQITTAADSTSGLARERVVHAFDLEGRLDAAGGRWMGHLAEVSAVAFSPTANRILTGDQKGNCLLWQWDDRGRPPVPVRRLDGHSGKIVAAAFLPAGDRVLTASRDNTIAVWDVATGRELADRRMVHRDRSGGRALIGMALSADGRHLLSCTEDRTLHLWDVESGRELDRRFELRGGRDALLARVKALADSARWSESAVDRVRTMLHELSGRRQQQSGEPGTRAVSTNGDRPLAELSPIELARRFAAAFGSDRTGQTITADELLRPTINAVDISPDGRLGIGANNVDGRVHVWDLETGRELPVEGGQGLVWSVLFAPNFKEVDGRRTYDYLTVGGDGAVLWDAESGRRRISFEPPDAVASAFFSPDGKHVVTASWDNSARLWDTTTGKDILKLEGHTGQVNHAEFSQDGNHVLTASQDDTVRLWEIDWEGRKASVVWTFQGHTDDVLQASYAPNGRLIVTASRDGTARVLAAEDGRELAGLQHARAVLCAAFSSDSLRIATGCDDLIGRVWDISSDEPVAAPVPGRPVELDVADLVGRPRLLLELEGHTAPVTAVAFSRDERSTRALSGSRDNTVKVWDAIPRDADQHRGQEIMTLKGHTREVTSVQFSPDGRQVLTASQDGTAIVWLTIDWTQGDADAELVRGRRPDRRAPGTNDAVAVGLD